MTYQSQPQRPPQAFQPSGHLNHYCSPSQIFFFGGEVQGLEVHHHLKTPGYVEGFMEEHSVDMHLHLHHPRWKQSDTGWILRGLLNWQSSDGVQELGDRHRCHPQALGYVEGFMEEYFVDGRLCL